MLIRDQTANHCHEGPFWLKTSLMKDHPSPKPLSKEIILTCNHSWKPDPNPFSWGTNLSPEPLSWRTTGPKTALVENTLTSVFWKAKPKASLVRDHSDSKSPVRDKTQKHCQEGPSRPQTTLNKDCSDPTPLMKNHTDPKLLMREHPNLNQLLLGTNLTQTHSQEITLTQSHSREITLSHNHTWETPLTQNPGTESRKWSEVWSLVVRWRCPEW